MLLPLEAAEVSAVRALRERTDGIAAALEVEATSPAARTSSCSRPRVAGAPTACTSRDGRPPRAQRPAGADRTESIDGARDTTCGRPIVPLCGRSCKGFTAPAAAPRPPRTRDRRDPRGRAARDRERHRRDRRPRDRDPGSEARPQITYTDVHLQRLLFFQGLMAPWPLAWEDTRSRSDSAVEGGPHHLRAAASKPATPPSSMVTLSAEANSVGVVAMVVPSSRWYSPSTSSYSGGPSCQRAAGREPLARDREDFRSAARRACRRSLS